VAFICISYELVAVSMLPALLLDVLVGEPSRLHPLVGFGRVASLLERACLKSRAHAKLTTVLGALAWTVLVLLPPLGLALLMSKLSALLSFIVGIFALYFCIGNRALVEHARAISRPLIANDESAARVALSRIVSRDTASLGEGAISSAAVESVLENGSDAVLAPLFWFLVLGAPAALLYRLANTLDAMWGYKTERFANFGYTAARMDDLLNRVPARCCASLYALAGDSRRAIRCWRDQAHHYESPNAGPVMASGSGALQIINGGWASYQGKARHRSVLGTGEPAAAKDIERSIRLLQISLLYFLLMLTFSEVLLCSVFMAAN
jgi:adenosylcobinamide-phosphate synthase